jgi:hypothetical protein
MMEVLEVFFGAYCPCIDFGQAFTFDARLSDGLGGNFRSGKDARITNSIGQETGEDGKKKPGLA